MWSDGAYPWKHLCCSRKKVMPTHVWLMFDHGSRSFDFQCLCRICRLNKRLLSEYDIKVWPWKKIGKKSANSWLFQYWHRKWSRKLLLTSELKSETVNWKRKGKSLLINCWGRKILCSFGPDIGIYVGCSSLNITVRLAHKL